MKQKKLLILVSILILCLVTPLMTFGVKRGFTYYETRIKRFFLFVDKYSFHPIYYAIRLTNGEKQFLIKNIKNSKSHLEYGSGGSTYLTLLHSKAKVVSVESDEEWLNFMREWTYIREQEKSRLTFFLVDIGETGDWGIPKNNKKKNNYPLYSKQVFEKFGRDFDTVFIDGRFRVACALQVILNCPQTTKILIHDFSTRTYYHSILEFLDIIGAYDTMYMFRIKPNIDKKAVEKMYDKYKYDWR